MSEKNRYIEQLRRSFPGLQNENLEDRVAENLISPFVLNLPATILKQAQESISAIFAMRETPAYLNHYSAALQQKGLTDPGNKSILMSYDFHVNDQQQLKLIEINTNASFLALGSEMYKMAGVPLPVPDFSMNEIRQDIFTEMKLQGKTPSADFKIAIIDEQPQDQRLYVEFLVYQELFKSWGWNSQILDYRQAFTQFQPEFIYNRYTDFFLNEPSSALLREKYLDRSVCLSPQPFEYFLLADKQRLIDWKSPGFLASMPLSERQRQLIDQVTPQAHSLSAANSAELWTARKHLFFKPKNAFGSKQSYRGSSISHKAFNEMLVDETIAQEYVPPSEETFNTTTGPVTMKYDLRCYAYQGRLQLILARLYQGQVTNLKTPLGGFACVKFN